MSESNTEAPTRDELLQKVSEYELKIKLLTEQVSDWKFEFNSLLDDVKRITDGM